MKNSYQGINHSIFKACWQNQRHVNNAYAKHSMFKACGWNQSHVNHARDCIYIDVSRMGLVAMLGLSNGDPFMLKLNSLMEIFMFKFSLSFSLSTI